MPTSESIPTPLRFTNPSLLPSFNLLLTLRNLISHLLQPSPLPSSYAHIFQLLTGRNLLKLAQQTHAHLTVRGINPNPFLGAKIVAFYASCTCLDASVSVFERVELGSGLLYNAVIRAFAKSWFCDRAIGLYVNMRDYVWELLRCRLC